MRLTTLHQRPRIWATVAVGCAAAFILLTINLAAFLGGGW